MGTVKNTNGSNGNGRAPDDAPSSPIQPRKRIHQLPHAYWVGFLSTALLRISRAKTLKEARGIARDGLHEVSDPLLGPREISEEVRASWRAETRKDDDE